MPARGGDVTATLRERREDFATDLAVLAGLSLDRRPGALALDYRTAFAPGPQAVGDASAGLLARAWRAVAGAADVRLARAAADGAGWEAETVLFAYSGQPIVELGLAFDQNGRAVVCAERATGPAGAAEVWLYRYDPIAAGYVFGSLGAGRTPRVLLDTPGSSADSDVVLFYVSDAANAVVYRLQRDRYAVAAATSLLGAAGLYLEAAGRDDAGRLRLVAARRDPAADTWALVQAATAHYPIRLRGGDDALAPAATLAGVEVRRVVLTPGDDPEAGTMTHALTGVVVYDPVVRVVAVDESRVAPVHALTGVLVRPLAFRVDARDPADGGHLPTHSLRGVQVQTLVVVHPQPADADYHTASHALLGMQVRALVRVLSPAPDPEQHLPSHALTGIQVRPLVDTRSLPVETEQPLPAHALSSIAVVYLVREVHDAGEPSQTENQYVAGHALRAVSVGP